MSDKFEESIAQFYEKERIANTQLLNLSEEPKVTNHHLANNLDFILKHIILLSRVSLKNFHQILDRQEALEARILKLESSTQSLLLNKPLSVISAKKLVAEITKQPKEIEQQALSLLSKVEAKVDRIDKVVDQLSSLL